MKSRQLPVYLHSISFALFHFYICLPMSNRNFDCFDEELLDEEMFEGENENCETEPEEWTIITALNRVLDLSRGSQLSEEFWTRARHPLDFLNKELGFNDIQVIILAMLVESGEPLSWRGMGKYLRCTRLTMMTYTDDVDDLVNKRWLYRRATRENGGMYEAYTLEPGVITALRHNTVFVPENLENLDIDTFCSKLENYLDRNLGRSGMEFKDIEEWIVRLCTLNPQLPLSQAVSRYSYDLDVQALFLMIVYDYAQWANSEDEGLTIDAIDRHFSDEYDVDFMRHLLANGNHVLIKDGLIEQKCGDGMTDTDRYLLTRKCKEDLLDGYRPSCSKCNTHNPHRRSTRDLKKHAGIKEKHMFYNITEAKQIERLTSLLSQEHLSEIQERLEKESFRKGFACLFYGLPGTGKTETVLQIARQTGRDIMQIDIAGMRDKYVGESEKNIKHVFSRYRDLCKQCEVMPILFFNEADAIFGKRTAVGGVNSSVQKMDNAMQNIILQEMEDFEGILIATTNLTCNLDDAFERRFLFKVEFQKPDEEVKAKLWCSMLGDGITEEDAHRLASRYDFSGGQIENIARKRTIEYILSGQKADFQQIDEFCQHEMLNKKKERTPIGF